ncbi:hypothetical protein PORY_000213 [Pneumocystis oryctolagi]|uniref:Uncharacterized protein n=1 Tax=Pneumocystis oryctolagi TaxID=42067 RepID=A0ACB7CFR1_9ASCO|nr:hypothetical protein PORY_000213 [Pneumocystis oryctolagi]
MDSKKIRNVFITDFFQPESSVSKFSIQNKSLAENSNEENIDFKNPDFQKSERISIDPVFSNYHFSLETLLKDQENRKKRYELFDRASKAFNTRSNDLMGFASFVDSGIEIAVGKEKGKELQAVLNKVDILKKQMHWSFFTNSIEQIDLGDIPVEDFEPQCDMLIFEKDKFSFFLITGYFSNMIDSGKIFSVKFVQWFLDKLCVEKNEMMLYGYFSILLKIYSSTSCQAHILSECQVKRIFLLLGAANEAINIESSIELENIENHNNNLNNDFFFKIINLKFVLNLLKVILLNNRLEKRCILLIFSIITKLYIDLNCALYLGSSLYLCYLQLLNSISNVEFRFMAFDMFNIAYNITKNSFMRLCILQSFPVEHMYGRILRSALASSMLMNICVPPNDFPDNPILPLSRIFDYMQTSRPFFPIDSNTNYFELCISIYMLDYILSQPLHQDNQIIEKICKLLKNIDEKILDSKSTFILKTEAKAKIQRLLLRLMHTSGIFSKMHQSTLEYHFNKM